MKDIVLPTIVREGFVITVERHNGICLKLSGNADMEMVPILGPYLRQVHEKSCREGARSVTVDLRDLYFMNSACFKSFITWIASINTLNDELKYDVRFLTNPRLNWQKRNLRSILDFAPTIVAVQEG